MKKINNNNFGNDNKNNLDGDKFMMKNKCVYIVFTECFMLDIDAVCASKKDVQTHLTSLKDNIIDFLRSDKVSVMIEKSDLEEDGVSYSITSNVPGYDRIVCKAEVEDSQDKSLSEIQHVWVVWSVVEPYGHTVHLTEKAVEEYLKSNDWMDDKGNIKNDVIVQYEKFELVNSSHINNN